MLRNELMNLLQQGLAAMAQPSSMQQINQLIDYIELIGHWNHTFNLTAITNPKEMVLKHLLDSISLVPLIKGKKIIDIGTGAGLPGIPLAIFLPNHEITLADSNQKKTRFLRQAIHTLQLSHLQVVAQRIEHFHPPQLFEVVVSRAFSKLHTLLEQSQPMIIPGAQLLAMKGAYPLQELTTVQPPFYVVKTHPITIPFMDAQRHVVEISFLPEGPHG